MEEHRGQSWAWPGTGTVLLPLLWLELGGFITPTCTEAANCRWAVPPEQEVTVSNQLAVSAALPQSHVTCPKETPQFHSHHRKATGWRAELFSSHFPSSALGSILPRKPVCISLVLSVRKQVLGGLRETPKAIPPA